MKRQAPRSWRRAIATLALVGSLAACKTDRPKAPAASPPVEPAMVSIDTGGRRVEFRVEVATTPEEQARGLMYRTRLAADTGMIFVFDEPSVQRFWMKNTLIPLDMVFIGADRRVVGVVENAAPETETERKVNGPSQYVLEIGGGLAAKLGIRAGEAVDFRGVPSP